MSDSKENPHLNPGKVYYDDYIFKVEILSFSCHFRDGKGKE